MARAIGSIGRASGKTFLITFEQRGDLKTARERAMQTSGEDVLGKENSKCEGLEAKVYLMNRKEVDVMGKK